MRKILLVLIIISIVSCQKTNKQEILTKNTISLKKWIHELEVYSEIIMSDEKCKFIDKIHNNLTLNEFKDPFYHDLAKCYVDKQQDSVKHYLLRSADGGFHPKRIDKDIFDEIWKEIKDDIYSKNNKFWSQVDTTYFVDFENAVIKDQSIRNTTMQNPIKRNFEEMKIVDSLNQNLLNNYIKIKGHFPKSYPSSFFIRSRLNLSPHTIAGHANDTDKLRYIDIAIEDAKKGLISWRAPIYISNLLIVSGISHKENYPFWLLSFDNVSNIIKNDKTYLELHNIYKMLIEPYPNNSLIIRPSKYSEKHNIDELMKIKSIFVEEYPEMVNRIFIEEQILQDEINYQNVREYKYIYNVIK